MKKTVISILLSLAILFTGLFVAARAEDTSVEYKTAADAVSFMIADRNDTTPIRIVPATLTNNGVSCDVYLIGLLGVKDNRNQVNSGKNLVPAAFNRDNSYSELVRSAILETVPAGSSLVFVCHSLGGMVAQHLRTDETLTGQYEIVNVLTAGSPLILVEEAKAEGGLHRLADKYDVIPFLSPATLRCLKKQLSTAHREDGGYFFDPDGAHNLSYLRNDVWGGYDALGVKGGNASLSFDASEVQVFGVVPRSVGSGE